MSHRTTLPIREPLRCRTVGSVVVALLLAGLVAVALAPLLMPPGYSMIEHSISESGGQGIHGAWLARSAFLFVGFAVLLLVGITGDLWGRWGRSAFRLYAVATIAAGVFAHGPWEEVAYDNLEGYLHTVAAFFAGLGFALGVFVVGARRPRGSDLHRALDVLALIAVAVLPATMLIFDDYTGIQQRFLALVGFTWLFAETWRVRVVCAQSVMSQASK